MENNKGLPKSNGQPLCMSLAGGPYPAFTGPFSGRKKRLAFASVAGSSVQKLFFDTFSQIRFGR